MSLSRTNGYTVNEPKSDESIHATTTTTTTLSKFETSDINKISLVNSIHITKSINLLYFYVPLPPVTSLGKLFFIELTW